jgi:hypothetical protein
MRGRARVKNQQAEIPRFQNGLPENSKNQALKPMWGVEKIVMICHN